MSLWMEDDDKDRCDDCGDSVDHEKSVCPECQEQRHEAWRKHQDRLRDSRLEVEDILRTPRED